MQNTKYKELPFGREKLFKTLQIHYEGISKNDVSNFLKNSQTAQLHTVPKIEKVHTPIVTTYPLERLQADLIDLESIKGYNHQHRYILTIVDHFSKYAWAYSLTRKTALKVNLAFQDLINNQLKDKQIHILQTDNGKEFLNKTLVKLLSDKNIKHITSTPYSPRTNGGIERFNRTLKQMIFKKITSDARKDFVNFLSELINNYNNSYHSIIKNTPNAVFNLQTKRILEETKDNIQENADKMKYKPNSNERLKRGDYVRISNMTKSSVKKDLFNKKYVQNYSKDIYKIFSVGKISNTYRLVNIKTNEKLSKKYYFDQLLKIDYDEFMKQEDAKKHAVDDSDADL